jgi:methionine-S-sulfoxide reductase
VEKAAPLVVPNVHEFPGHIACDGETNSEIVIPLFRKGAVFGVLDLDSPRLSRFGPGEERVLVETGKVLNAFFDRLDREAAAPEPSGREPSAGEKKIKTIYLAGGCFWGAEKYLASIPGVTKTEVGYANGRTANPSYEDVCRKNTGHAETVKVEYDSAVLSLSGLLELFYLAIDPASLNRQGPDIGTQYRTGIYYTSEEDRPVIEASLAALQKGRPDPVVVEARALENYYAAEEYHQKYLDKNPGGYCHIGSRTFEKLREKIRPA